MSTDRAPADDVPSAEDRVSELQRLLMESTDAGVRAHAHMELGRAALRHGHFERAIRHFREALIHDPRLEAARMVLAELGEGGDGEPGPGGGRLGAVRKLLAKVRRR